MQKRIEHLLVLAKECETAVPGPEMDGRIWCAIHGHEFVMLDGDAVVYRVAGADKSARISVREVPPASQNVHAALVYEPAVQRWRVECSPETGFKGRFAEEFGRGMSAGLALISAIMRTIAAVLSRTALDAART